MQYPTQAIELSVWPRPVKGRVKAKLLVIRRHEGVPPYIEATHLEPGVPGSELRKVRARKVNFLGEPQR